MVGREVLDLVVLVRIQVPEPFDLISVIVEKARPRWAEGLSMKRP